MKRHNGTYLFTFVTLAMVVFICMQRAAQENNGVYMLATIAATAVWVLNWAREYDRGEEE